MARRHKPLPESLGSFDVGSMPLAAFDAPQNASSAPGEQSYESCRMKVLEEFIKLKPPVFEGRPDPLAAEIWLKAVKEMFDTIGVLEQYRVGFATYLFEGSAEDWLDFKGDDYNVANLNWEEFETLFRETYIPDETLKSEMLAELCILGQRNMTVARYYARFIELSRYDPAMVADPVLRCVKFRRRLRRRIRTHLAPFTFTDINVLVDAALHVEASLERYVRKRKQGKEKDKKTVKKGQMKGHSPQNGFTSQSNGPSGSKRCKLHSCNLCGQVGHKMRRCPFKQLESPVTAGRNLRSRSSSSASGSGRFKSYSCHACAQLGHKKSKCPFAKLQSECDVGKQLRAQSGSASLAAQSSQTLTQPTGSQYQNMPPSFATTPQQSQNVAFTLQMSGSQGSYHQSRGDSYIYGQG